MSLTLTNKQSIQEDLKLENKRKEKEKEKFRLDTSNKSLLSLILTIPLSQVYSQTNMGPENVSIK